MMFLWNPDMVRFMKDASEHTEYHAALAEKILKRLGPAPTVLDAGCGLGYLSLALSKGAALVAAVDKNPAPLAVLKENVEKRGIKNILPLCADLEALELPGPLSAAVFCFCGDGRLVFETAGRLKAAKAFAIGGVKGHREPDRESIGELLKRLKVPHEEEVFELSLDQPFRSEEDALLFFRTYHEKEPYSQMVSEEFLSRLKSGREGEFPFLLPIGKRLCMTVFNPADAPDLMEPKLRKTEEE